ncbi:MAG: hypothetical protein HY907_04725 [Deltaproteobacteria bacterium]|nr:hypothetical protein [Deltaproteobacteria bacterium]
MKKMILAAIPLMAVLALPKGAAAMQTITPGTDGISAIAGGVLEFGIDNMLLVRYDSTGDDQNGVAILQATYVGGITPRFVLADNFSLAANLQIFYGKLGTTTTAAGVESEVSSSNVGFLGILMANYYVRLGYGMFFAPGVGAGGFYGVTSTPAGTGRSIDGNLYGGAVKLDLGFVFYAGPHFNIKGGPDVLCRFGKAQPDEALDMNQDLFTIEAAFHLGLAYSI